MSDDNEQYYIDNSSRLNTVIGGNRAKHWLMIRECHDTEFYINDSSTTSWDLFIVYMKNKYGIQLEHADDGMISSDIQIVDEKKYTLFLLKYA